MRRINFAALFVTACVALSPGSADAEPKTGCVLEPIDGTAFFDVFVGDDQMVMTAKWLANADCTGTAFDGPVEVMQHAVIRPHGNQRFGGPTQILIDFTGAG